ncbi:MAG: PASTA domain-containing protein [Lachnospiraceae bacterium]
MIREGMFLGDRYEILEKIGSGGMADVYKARCHRLNRYVAIKVLKEELCNDETVVKKFTEEAQAAACLSHNNIVGIYDVNQEGDIHYIVMELLEGITLKEYIKHKGSLTAKETVEISIQVAEGLSAAHAQNIIHRDVKPQNIMLTNDGKVKVADFGIAHVVNSNTINVVSMGSVHYSSPEQSRGKYCDARSDIYSLGVTMYEMITGIVPFDGENVVSIAIAHANDIVVPPSKIVEGVPMDVERIILKCLEKRPENRYESANALISDLEKTEVAVNIGFGAEVHTEPEAVEEIAEEEEKVLLGDKVLNILNIVGCIAILVLVLYIALRWSGVLSSNNNKQPSDSVDINVVEGTSNGVDIANEESTDENANVTTTMPQCVGLSMDEAEALLESYYLVAEFSAEWVYSDKYDAGYVCEQEYKEGKKLDKYTKVELTVSLGTDKFEINDSYIGMNRNQFEQIVKKYEFDIDWKDEYNEDIPKGQIIKLDPSSGKIKMGSKLTVYYSKGPQYVAVPQLVGKSETEVEKLLTDNNLKVGTRSEAYSNEYEKGYVISQSLGANTEVAAESSVNYVVSLGRKTVTVPNVVGKTASEAKNLLASYELLCEVKEEFSSKYQAGYVISQNPKEGASAKSQDTVTIVVSKGAEEVTVNVVGKEESAAKNELKKLDITVSQVKEEFSNEQKSGYVIRVEKASSSGTDSNKFYRGDSVILVVSKGAAKVSVPNVLGSTLEEGISALQAVNLIPKYSTETVELTASEANKKGVKDGEVKIVSQSIAAGTEVDINTEVVLKAESYTVKPDSTTEAETTEEDEDVAMNSLTETNTR